MKEDLDPNKAINERVIQVRKIPPELIHLIARNEQTPPSIPPLIGEGAIE